MHLKTPFVWDIKLLQLLQLTGATYTMDTFNLILLGFSRTLELGKKG